LRAPGAKTFVLDGELVIPVKGGLSFDALQMRLHPAESRITDYRSRTPATFIVFDCLLSKAGQSLLAKPFDERRTALEEFFEGIGEHSGLSITPLPANSAGQEWLSDRQVSVDGVVAKRSPFLPACERAMLKVKNLRSADCVVGASATRPAETCRIATARPLRRQRSPSSRGFHLSPRRFRKTGPYQALEKLIAPPGFTGGAPGGPSRWSTARSAEWQPLCPTLVVEVRYDHITGNRFRHGTGLVRWRPDKAPQQCTFEQLPRAVAAIELQKVLTHLARMRSLTDEQSITKEDEAGQEAPS